MLGPMSIVLAVPLVEERNSTCGANRQADEGDDESAATSRRQSVPPGGFFGFGWSSVREIRCRPCGSMAPTCWDAIPVDAQLPRAPGQSHQKKMPTTWIVGTYRNSSSRSLMELIESRYFCPRNSVHQPIGSGLATTTLSCGKNRHCPDFSKDSGACWEIICTA